MKTNNAQNIWNIIETAIKSGISGSKIADKLENCGMTREQAVMVVACVGAHLNMQNGMTWEDGFKMYAGI